MVKETTAEMMDKRMDNKRWSTTTPGRKYRETERLRNITRSTERALKNSTNKIKMAGKIGAAVAGVGALGYGASKLLSKPDSDEEQKCSNMNVVKKKGLEEESGE